MIRTSGDDRSHRPAALPESTDVGLCSGAAPATQPHFTLIETGEARKDLERRREVKFLFRSADLGKVRGLLQSELRRQVHNKTASTVQSLYFDSPDFSACHDNLDGVGERRKLRLRWYDTPLPERHFFLELKWRSNRITGKHRLQFDSSVSLSALSYSEIRRQLSRVVPDRFQRPLELYSEPVVLVSYRREHFVSFDRAIRLTLDYDLRFFDQLGRRGPSARFPVACDDLVVLEGKTPVGGEMRLRELLEPLAVRAHRCSKYVHGCRLIGAVLKPE